MGRERILELLDTESAFWQEKVLGGIEKHRKGNGVITVVDKTGMPLPGAKVKVVQKSHAFRFGANLFMLDELETEEKNKAYKEAFSRVFNMATLPFYWNATEPEKGNLRYAKESTPLYRRPSIDLCMEFCQAHGIEPREHGLAYERFFPTWLSDYSLEDVKREFERRCQEIASRYADKIHTIEVTNEMDWQTGKTALYDDPDFIEWCFKTARKYFPNNQLGCNESTPLPWMDKGRTADKYYAYIEASLLKGAPIDAIGMQYHHFHRKENEYDATRLLLNPEKLYAQMDLYARLGKPLQVTEITLPAYSGEAEDERIQAEMLEKLYTIWFSHPAVEQIIYWNLVDGYAYVENPTQESIRASQGDMTIGENYFWGGLLRFDMSPKPAYERLVHLTQKVWHTEEELVAGEDGNASFRGFFGDYQIQVEVAGRNCDAVVSFQRDGDRHYTIVV